MRFILRSGYRIAALLGAVILSVLLTACKGSGKDALDMLCDTLRSDYTCSLSYEQVRGESSVSGTALLERQDTVTELTMLSPELLSGVSVEYDVKGSPSSVSVHFSGLDATLPEGALGRINRIASLAADDFIDVLGKVGADKIYEYDIGEDKLGYYVTVFYDEAEVTVFFSAGGEEPYRLEYLSKDTRANVVFTDFKVLYEEE